MGAAPRFSLGNYEPLLELAAGGMATVYIARQVGAAGFERLVVLKRVHRHLLRDRDFYDMFRDEARVASLIRHPNVVSVTDVVESEAELFLVMDYVESTALSTLLKAAGDAKTRLTPPIAARIVADALSGLYAAHEGVDMRGERLEVVHRDVSPQNIIVGVDGTSRLIDFGIAKAAHRIAETRSGSIKGKLGYMSPEGAQGVPLDRRADVFAAGVVLHEALTGRRLFAGVNEFDTLRRVTEAKADPPSQLVPGVPRALDAVVLHALERDPARRFQTAAEFLEALEQAIPAAPPRDVRACLEQHCGSRLTERRQKLRGLLEGTIAPLPLTATGTYMAAGATGSGNRPITRSDVGAVPSLGPGEATELLVVPERGEGTESQIAATHDPPFARPRTWTRAVILGSLAIAALTAGLAFTFAGRRPRGTPTSGDARAVPSLAVTAAPSASATPRDPSVVELQLVADAPIESVRATGIRSVRLDGLRARVEIASWQGDLAIEAVLAGGKVVHAVADPAGPRELKLTAAVVEDPRGPAAHPSEPGSTRPVARPPKPQELHDNPYNQ